MELNCLKKHIKSKVNCLKTFRESRRLLIQSGEHNKSQWLIVHSFRIILRCSNPRLEPGVQGVIGNRLTSSDLTQSLN